MSNAENTVNELVQAVQSAAREGTALQIQGGLSKSFYGREPRGRALPVAGNAGVVEYEPTELVITARAGTPLNELQALLASEGQMLAFEPPRFGETATLGGTLACGFSGPRRPYAGAARDFVLGVQVLTGKGEVLRFGGQVMKNVAGYDVSRLMVGAMGSLGVLLEASLKVLPLPDDEATLALEEADPARAVERMNRWAGQPLPLTGAAYQDGRLCLRLSGSQNAVRAAREAIGGQALDARLWEDLREHRLELFAGEEPLWRLSLPPATPPLALEGRWILDWGGAQRWLRTQAPADAVREAAAAAGGHASVFRGGDRTGQVFHPLAPALRALHQRLKNAFDPGAVLNPGRMYPEL